jgi:hypothetical protein
MSRTGKEKKGAGNVDFSGLSAILHKRGGKVNGKIYGEKSALKT